MVDLLVRSAKFMEDNGITFYLYGGSAIGALRHNGFIPWDDDLDIIVTRENFKKIKERFEFIQWDDIDFICVESNPHYFKPSGFFSLKNDVCTSKSRIFYRGPCLGTVMDIFASSEHHPYTDGLFGSIPGLGTKKRRLKPIQGMMPDPANLPEGCKFSPRCEKCMQICREKEPPTYINGSHRIRCFLYGGKTDD